MCAQLKNIVSLRIWPLRTWSLQKIVSMLCCTATSAWTNVVERFGQSFPHVRSIVDLSNSNIVFGDDTNVLLANLLVQAYAY